MVSSRFVECIFLRPIPLTAEQARSCLFRRLFYGRAIRRPSRSISILIDLSARWPLNSAAHRCLSFYEQPPCFYANIAREFDSCFVRTACFSWAAHAFAHSNAFCKRPGHQAVGKRRPLTPVAPAFRFMVPGLRPWHHFCRHRCLYRYSLLQQEHGAYVRRMIWDAPRGRGPFPQQVTGRQVCPSRGRWNGQTVTTAQWGGSSPRAWGRCGDGLDLLRLFARFIPTCVGQINSRSNHFAQCQRFIPTCVGQIFPTQGICPEAARFIPTCVGQIRSYPEINSLHLRFIPTCVGQML